MTKTIKHLSFLAFITLFVTLLIWLPHYLNLSNFYNLNFNQGFNTIYRNFDGLEYIVIAKTFYNPSEIAKLPLSQSANYYAAHFPGFSVLILLLSPILGMLKSMLFITILFTLLSSFAFYFLVRDFKLTSQPLFLSLIFLILPARWLVVHSIGSSEPIFIFFVISSIYFFMKYELQKKSYLIWMSSLFGLAAQLTRPPGILLFLALVLYIKWSFFHKKSIQSLKERFLNYLSYYPLILIPLGLLFVFSLFYITYNDFWAYFHSGDNIHLVFPPFQVFNKSEFWVGEIWLEDIIYIYLLSLLGGLLLLKQKLYPLAFFVLTYLTASFLVVHRDISRYVLPVFPFIIIAFEKILLSREFKVVLILLLFAIYLYAENFLLSNTAPVANLSIFN